MQDPAIQKMNKKISEIKIDIGPFKKEMCHSLLQAACFAALPSTHAMTHRVLKGALWVFMELAENHSVAKGQ